MTRALAFASLAALSALQTRAADADAGGGADPAEAAPPPAAATEPPAPAEATEPTPPSDKPVKAAKPSKAKPPAEQKPVFMVLTTSKLLNPETGLAAARGRVALVDPIRAGELQAEGKARPASDAEVRRAAHPVIDLT